jgi:hypothetical protein
MAADFCSSAAVPNIGELKALTHLYLKNTGITGTVDFDHHPMMITDFCCAFYRHRWNWWMCQSAEIDPLRLLFVDRFVQWSSPHDDFDFNSSFAVVPNIGELKNLEVLNLSETGITGTLDFNHHPMMITDFCCAFQTSMELKDASI